MCRCAVLLFSLLLMCGVVHAITIGSDAAVTRFYTQVSMNSGDVVTGFTELQGGLFITAPAATATWNALFPVSGVVALNSGILALQRDFSLSDIATLSLPGSIVGNGYTFDLALTATSFLSGCIPQLAVTQAVGTEPNIGSIGWSFDDQFVALSGTARATNAIENYRFNGTSLTLVGNITSATANVGTQACLAWRPSAYYIATGGTNGFVHVYSVNSGTGALTQTSSNDQGANVNALAWHPAGRYLVAATSSTANEVVMYPVTAAGVLGTAIIQNRPNNGSACDWMVTGTYLAVGFVAAAANEIEIYALGGTPAAPTLTLSLGFANGVNVTTNVIKWNPVYPTLFAAGLANTGAGDNVQIWQYNPTANTVTKLTSISGLAVSITAVDWSNDGNCLMVGIGSTTAAATKLQVYAYNAQQATLGLTTSSAFTNAVATSTAGRYSPINNYIAQGASPTATTAQLRISVPTNTTATFSNLTTVLHNRVDLQNYFITLSGNCVIQGNNNILSLASTATLAVAANSTLTLKNITIKGVTAGSIQMLATTSNLILDNANLVLDGTYSFTQGSLTINKDVTISGFNRTFLFSSSQPCIIRSKSQLLLDELVTWSHVPPTTARNLLQCTDRSSYLYLNGASLVTTRTGLNLTKGTLVVDRHAYVASDALVAAEAVTLGDGVSATNDMVVQIYPAATLDVTKGILVNNNV